MFSSIATPGGGWENQVTPSRRTGYGTAGGAVYLMTRLNSSTGKNEFAFKRGIRDVSGTEFFSETIDIPIYSPAAAIPTKTLYARADLISSTGSTSQPLGIYANGAWIEVVTLTGNTFRVHAQLIKDFGGDELEGVFRFRLAYDVLGNEVIFDQEITITTATT